MTVTTTNIVRRENENQRRWGVIVELAGFTLILSNFFNRSRKFRKLDHPKVCEPCFCKNDDFDAAVRLPDRAVVRAFLDHAYRLRLHRDVLRRVVGD
jgi:hypothetical protein